MNLGVLKSISRLARGLPWLALFLGLFVAAWAWQSPDGSGPVSATLMIGCLLLSFGVVWMLTSTWMPDQTQADKRLLQHGHQYRRVFEVATNALFIFDSNGTIVEANPAACMLYGYSREELVGLTGKDIVHPDSHHLFADFTRQVATTGRFFAESKDVRKDGSVFDIEVQGSSLLYNGKPHLLAVVNDITQRKKTEQALQDYAQALESANRRLEEGSLSAQDATRAKSEFLADMSHELRTPLTAILGYAEMLRGDGDLSKAPPSRIEAIDTIIRNGDHLLRLINDILDLSKIEARRLEVQRTDCSPLRIASEVQALMNIRAQAKQLTLLMECPASVPERIATDPIRLRQILINLVGNAIKFTVIGGVRLRIRLLEQDPANPLLEFAVIDTGVGLTKGQASAIFQPFAQIENTASHRSSGTGLGLTISRKLANLLGGDVTVSSEPGEGSTFRITIATGPLQGIPRVDLNSVSAELQVVKPERAEISPCRLDARILLAEDGPDNQRLISLLLRKAGAEVTCVENGRLAADEALRQWRAGKPFDIVLMDMRMPVVDGYQATRELRQAGYEYPIVALTARAMKGDRHDCLDAGCDDYATKPIDRDTLLTLVARHLGREKKHLATRADAES